ncbi:hypothetical protein Goshw_012703, partial [Gossypium schwendimanii]|nr:hypothetical protein [Gossypium schwendimanii]
MGFQDLVVEGDALTVIKKLKSELVDRSTIDNIINEIQRKIFSFVNLSFEFTPRKTNEAAHALATRGKGSFLSESGDALRKRLSLLPSDKLRFRRNLVWRFNGIIYSYGK